MRRRTWIARLALVALSTGVSLGVAEGIFRVWTRAAAKDARSDDAWRARLQHMNATIYRRAADPRLVYEPVPGSAVEMPYGTAGFNLASMRDDRAYTPLRGARPRIAILGDSIVWGEDVSSHEALPQSLDRALHGRADVLNFGVTGYDTTQEATWFRVAVAPFHPSVVVLVYCLNDVMIMSGPYHRYATPDEARRKAEQDAWLDRVAPVRAETLEHLGRQREASAWSQLLVRAQTVWRMARFERSDAYVDEYTLLYRDPQRVARVGASLADLASSVRAGGAEPILVISPVLRSWERYHWRWIHTLVAQMGRTAGFRVLDPYVETWSHDGTQPERLRLPGDSLHYSAEGNTTFARYLATQRLGVVP